MRDVRGLKILLGLDVLARKFLLSSGYKKFLLRSSHKEALVKRLLVRAFYYQHAVSGTLKTLEQIQRLVHIFKKQVEFWDSPSLTLRRMAFRRP